MTVMSAGQQIFERHYLPITRLTGVEKIKKVHIYLAPALTGEPVVYPGRDDQLTWNDNKSTRVWRALGVPTRTTGKERGRNVGAGALGLACGRGKPGSAGCP